MMKKHFLLTALMSLFILETYSQVNNKFKIDTTFKSLSVIIDQKPFQDNSKDYSKLLNGSEGNNFLFPRQQKSFALQPEVFGNIDKAQPDNMPLINPRGNFPMGNFKPDSTVRYSLQIKEIQH